MTRRQRLRRAREAEELASVRLEIAVALFLDAPTARHLDELRTAHLALETARAEVRAALEAFTTEPEAA